MNVLRFGKNWRTRTSFSLPSQPGNERIAMQRVADLVSDLNLPTDQLERLKTAVAEATMNAIEHGNKNDPSLAVEIEVYVSLTKILVRVTDQGDDRINISPKTPDLEAKLAGTQSPRGWGLFLIKNMVDELYVSGDGHHNHIDLIMYREGANHGSAAV